MYNLGMSRRAGQAILEYMLLVIFLALTIAVIVRNTNQTIYRFWTGLANQVALPCVGCSAPTPPPDINF